MEVVHVLETLSETGYYIRVFSSKKKAMKLFDKYVEELTNEELVIRHAENSFSVYTKDEEHVFSAEYVKKVVL